MKIVRRAALAAVSLSLAFAAPAMAQSAYPMDQGDFIELSAISVDDGHSLDYMNHLANNWRKAQDYAKSQGWITGYEVMVNAYPRKGEPDVYLLVRTARLPDAAEDAKRDEAYRAYMQRTASQLQAESGERAKYRSLSGSMLLRELRFRK